MRRRLMLHLGIGRDLRRDLGCRRRIQLAIEPGKEEFVVHCHSPNMASKAVRPRTSRLDTVPIGRSSNSAVSR